MVRAVRIAQDRGHGPNSAQQEAARAVLVIAGAMLALLGAVLFAGGYFSPLSGSAFHMLVGATLVATGVLIARRHRAGLWTYLIAFACTLAWSLRDVGSGSSLAFRLAGPVILLAILALLMPVLRNWRPRRAALAFVGMLLATVGIAAAAAAAPAAVAHGTAAAAQGTAAAAQGTARHCTPATDCWSGAATRPVPNVWENETNARSY